MENMLSLYDYLGHPAGKELGKLVANYAKLRKVNTVYRAVQTRTYQGYVTTYSREFLDEFFATMELIDDYVVNILEEIERLEQEQLDELNTMLNEDTFEFHDEGKVF